jgi:putative addiction module antidote
MQKLKIRKIGNSLGTILHSDIVAHLHVQEGDELFVFEDTDGVRITAYDPGFEKAAAVFQQGRRDYRDALRKLGQ